MNQPIDKQRSKNDEMIVRRLSLIVQQMGSDDPEIRDFARDSLDKMVDYDLHGQTQDTIEAPVGRELRLNTTRKDVDVLYKIRLLQKEKENKLKRRKPFLFF